MRIEMQDFKAASDVSTTIFNIKGVNYYCPADLVRGLQAYLVAASAMWSELKDYEIIKLGADDGTNNKCARGSRVKS